MLNDARVAIRAFRRAPLFYGGAAVILGLGIGLSTATFSIFHSVLLRPLPVTDQDRLTVLVGSMPGVKEQILPVSRRMLADLRRTAKTLDGVAGVGYDGPWQWQVRDPNDSRHSLQLRASVVTGNLFEVLGARAEIGRTLLAEDDDLGARRVAVISHELWLRAYGGEPGVIGRKLVDQSTGADYAIVGVMPAGLAFERGAELWRTMNAQFPIRADSDLDSRFAMFRVVGRLAPGSTMEASRQEFAAFIQRSMRDRNPTLAPHLGAAAHPLAEEVLGDARPVLVIISAAVAILLVIACLNVANLMLIRASSRTSELAVRSCLGASRLRLIRQFLVEGVVLAAAGGLFGVMIAAGALRAVIAIAPPGVPRIGEAGLDAPTLAAGIALSLFTVLICALGPALNISSKDLHGYVRSGARSVTSSKRGRLRRQSLVAAQVALAVVVITSAALLARTLDRLQHLNLGFDPDHLVAIEMGVPSDAPYDTQGLNELVDRVASRAAALPTVARVAAGIQTPFTNGGIDGWVSAEGESSTQHTSDPYSNLEFVTPSYFATLGIRLLSGRIFNDADGRSNLPVVVVSQSVARHYWPGQRAVGKKLHCLGDASLCSVIGVVEDTRYRDLTRSYLTVYRPSHQAPDDVFVPRALLVRTTQDPAQVLPSIRAAITQADPSVTLGRALPVVDLLNGPLAQPRLNAMLVAVFAGFALVLASAGIFGVLVFHVGLRMRELGIRQALGATPRALGLMLLREGMTLQAIGIACGIVVSLFATQSLRSLLFAVAPTDPVSLLGAAGVLVVCGLAAVIVPARRAARVDPVVALRAD
jgi:predicted permease